MKLLLIEDERELALTVQDFLQGEGYVVEWAADFPTADEKAALYEYDCLIVDINLPGGGSGLDVLRNLKRQRPETGVIIVSARNALDDRITGLDLGAVLLTGATGFLGAFLLQQLLDVEHAVTRELDRNIGEELGSDSGGAPHYQLLAAAMRHEFDLNVWAVIPESATDCFIRSMWAALKEYNPLHVLGAAYALEATATPELAVVLDIGCADQRERGLGHPQPRQRDHRMAAHGRVALIVQEQGGEIGLGQVGLDQQRAVHVGMAARLGHQHVAQMIQLGTDVTPLGQQRLALDRRKTGDDDAYRLTSGVHFDRCDELHALHCLAHCHAPFLLRKGGAVPLPEAG